MNAVTSGWDDQTSDTFLTRMIAESVERVTHEDSAHEKWCVNGEEIKGMGRRQKDIGAFNSTAEREGVSFFYRNGSFSLCIRCSYFLSGAFESLYNFLISISIYLFLFFYSLHVIQVDFSGNSCIIQVKGAERVNPKPNLYRHYFSNFHSGTRKVLINEPK